MNDASALQTKDLYPSLRMHQAGHPQESHHAVQFYEGEPFLVDAVGRFILEGLLEGEGIIVIARSEHLRMFSRALEAMGIDVQNAEETGQLQWQDATEVLAGFIADDHPQEQHFRAMVNPLIDRAVACGVGRVRAYGERVQMLWEQGNVAATLELERLWNDLGKSRRFTLLCGYLMGSFNHRAHTAGFQEICKLHGAVRPAEDLPQPEATEDRSRLVASLQQQARALQTESLERKQAEERSILLARACEILCSSLDYTTTLRNVVQLTLPRLADFAFFEVMEPDGHVRRIARAWQDPHTEAQLEATCPVSSEPQNMNLCALSSRRSSFHPQGDHDEMARTSVPPPHLELLRTLAVCSMITVPMPVEGRILGAFTLCFASSSRHHTAEDLALAEEIARRAAATVQNAHLHRDLYEANRCKEEALRLKEAADLRKDEFLAMLGHELRNPLAPIVTALKVMDLRDPSVPDQERAVIERQTHHLTRLFDDLMDLSRLTGGTLQLKREPLELASVVAKGIELAAPLLERRNHYLEVLVPTEGLQIEADHARLSQVVANLLTNAAKYAAPGSHISISAARKEERIVLEVQDDGMGINEAALATIFEPFVQGTRTLDRSEGGLGIGLPLIRSLVELHGGHVSAASEGLGKGSRFTVTLPAAEPAGDEIEPEPTACNAVRGSSTRRSLRILLVDDNVDASEMLGSLLQESGHEVEIVHDGPQGLEAARRFHPDVALLDIGLPVMDGYELGKRLRQEPGHEALRLFAVTGYGQRKDLERTRELGFDRHFVKPVKLEELEAALSMEAGSSQAP